MRRPRHAERHHWDQALAAGQDAAIARAELGELRYRVVHGFRRMIDERRGLHRARPLLEPETPNAL